jgi:histidinol-phosphatase (PHP family)
MIRELSERISVPQAGVTVADLAATFDAFLDKATRLKNTYADQIELLVGVETEHIFDGDLNLLNVIIERNKERIDFVVGSVHHAKEFPIDFSLETFEEALGALLPVQSSPSNGDLDPSDARNDAITALLISYFKAQRRLLEAFQPALVAHFDLPRLFIPETQLSSHPEAYMLALENIKYAVSYGALFELSAAPFRKGWETGYPGDEVVRMIQNEGGRFALSDDSHGPERVGLNFNRLKTWALGLGIERAWKLERQGGKIEAVEVNDVWNDGFWSRL